MTNLIQIKNNVIDFYQYLFLFKVPIKLYCSSYSEDEIE